MATPTWEHRPGTAPRLVHVTATARDGEVAGLLRGLVPAQAAAGVSAGWAVLGTDAVFLAFTRYLHHLLHGRADALTTERLAAAMPHYRSVLEPQAAWLAARLAPGDTVALHGPQTLGMAPVLADAGLRTVWHCHSGTTDEEASGPAAVWDAFRTELSTVDAAVSTLPEFAPRALPAARRHVLAPAVDPDAPRNQVLSGAEVTELLAGLGLTAKRAGKVLQDRPLPADAPMVLQLSRWAPLKDMAGVLRSVPELSAGTHVVLAGHDPAEPPGDPEGQAVLDEVVELWSGLSPADRSRVHLVSLSTQDQRAANALQRRADVVLQKSLAEGFGLTVTEAMLKRRAVVAADVGGLRQQISPGHNGMLVNPRDPGEVADAVRGLLDDPLGRRRLGAHAAASVHRRYLMSRLVAEYRLVAAPDPLNRASDAA
ncbi:glycosyltransferase [Actinophytocola sp.]|uniref:glycosyltransferase n=1 Tax=Actinophytocola sp. TaxID=1872138 RepID=UPI002D2F91A0|nr:glycosyltransferase [Actinophytocola sp.]HYQ70241.1 glycosyltransferase [Actinophytocola sp.]